MMSAFEKLDMGLTMALRAYRESADRDPDAGISVSLRFEGDLASIEALGFETDSVSDGEADGIVRFKDIPALVAHTGVIWIAAGQPPRPTLWSAATDIRARASTVQDVGTQGLWHTRVSPPGGPLLSVPKATGDGVIVAILDSGIDYTHPMFMSQLTPTKKSRILRIWDQGLTPTAYSQCPSPTLLSKPNNTYGVEYKNDPPPDDYIDQALSSTGTPLPHRDFTNHGTHVAGIAAGGKERPADGNAVDVGVAPEAGIIAVKVVDVPRPIRYYLPSNSPSNVEVGWVDRFEDAVLYCLRTAKSLKNPKPVVINMSLNGDDRPGDALDAEARWLDKVMDPTKPAGLSNFPKGAVVVTSVGNAGSNIRRTDRQAARIVVPQSGEITVPFTLEDARGATQLRWTQGAQTAYAPSVGVHFWYRRTPVPYAVKFAVRLPHGAGFGNDKAVGSPDLEIGFRHLAGPPPNDVNLPPPPAPTVHPPTVHRAVIRHEDPGSVPHPAGRTVHRHHVYFFVKPRVSGGTITYHPGTYEIRIRAPENTEIFALCEQKKWSAQTAVWFENVIPPAHSNIHPGSKYSATDTLGQHAITVAAYDETAGNHIASFSSRGPLRNFSANPQSQPLVASKPDIAAPGVNVISALSAHIQPRPWQIVLGTRFKAMRGTSCAAPMVAGVIALMLNKKKDLNTTQVRTILSGARRAAVNPATPPDSTDAYGSGMVDALPSHTNTP